MLPNRCKMNKKNVHKYSSREKCGVCQKKRRRESNRSTPGSCGDRLSLSRECSSHVTTYSKVMLRRGSNNRHGSNRPVPTPMLSNRCKMNKKNVHKYSSRKKCGVCQKNRRRESNRSRTRGRQVTCKRRRTVRVPRFRSITRGECWDGRGRAPLPTRAKHTRH